MFYVALLAIVFAALLFFSLAIRVLGEGRKERKGGPVIRSRERRGIVRFAEDPNDTQENFTRIVR